MSAHKVSDDARDGGFTLVELLVAIAILAVIAAPLSLGLITGLRFVGRSDEKFNDSRSACRIVVGPCCSFVASFGEYVDPLPSDMLNWMSFSTVDAVMPPFNMPVRYVNSLNVDPGCRSAMPATS